MSDQPSSGRDEKSLQLRGTRRSGTADDWQPDQDGGNLVQLLDSWDKPLYFTSHLPGMAPEGCRWICCICRESREIKTRSSDLRHHLTKVHGFPQEQVDEVFSLKNGKARYEHFGPCTEAEAKRNEWKVRRWTRRENYRTSIQTDLLDFWDEYRNLQNRTTRDPTTFLDIELDFAKFLSENFEADLEAFWDMVILVGDDNGRWAASVGEYITAMWPESWDHIKSCLGLLANTSTQEILSRDEAWSKLGQHPDVSVSGSDAANLDIVSRQSLSLMKLHYAEPQSVSLPSGKHRGDDLVVSATMVSQAGSRKTRLALSGNVLAQIELIRVLAWLRVVLVDDADGPCDVSVFFELVHRAEDYHHWAILIDEPLIIPPSDSTCWLPLMPMTPCAVNFEGLWRPPEMKGLELTFDLLCLLAGARYSIDYEDGVLLYGEKSLIYPVSVQAGCVQWHFLKCRPGDSPHVQVRGPRLLGTHLGDICAYTRHFLGLWTEPEITLGTANLDYSKLRFSQADPVPETRVKDSYTIGGSIQVPRVLTATANTGYKIISTRQNLYMKGPLPDYLHGKLTTPVILFSPSEKRAWLVSYVSVLLHLARCRASLRAELNYRIPACDRRANGGRAAWECIRSCYKDCLKTAKDGELLTEFEQNIKIEDHLQEIIECMERARRASTLAKGFFSKGFTRKRILGYELADIAKYKGEMIMKRCNLERFATGWAPLLTTVEYVFFYEGLADPIVPSIRMKDTWTTMGHCGATMWHEIPKHFTLLTASVPCLLYYAEKQGQDQDGTMRRLTSEYSWHCPSSQGPYPSCRNLTRCTCNRLQEVCHAGTEHRLPDLSNADEGAVVFKFADSHEVVQAAVQRENQLRLSATSSLELTDSGYSTNGTLPRSPGTQDPSSASLPDEEVTQAEPRSPADR